MGVRFAFGRRHRLAARMSLAPARYVTLRVLAAVRERNAYVSPVLESESARATLSDADRALANRLSRGTVETLGTLDEVLDARIAKPSGVEPRVRDALRVAAYEILFMRTPAHAVVHQAVDAVRHVRPQAAGLANAVLRRLAEDAATFPWGDPETDPAALARATGHPRWMLDMFTRDLGASAATDILRAHGEPAPLYARHNPFLGSLDEARTVLNADGADPIAALPDASSLLLRNERAAVRGRAVAEGLVIVTDAAAQVAPLAIGAQPGRRILDAGSGRGTKTVALQALAVAAGEPAAITGLDIHDFKTQLLDQRMGDLGVPGVTAVTADLLDPATPALLGELFDAVLLDAPCTGLGTLRRHPEQRWRVHESDVARLAAVQAALLDAAAALVRPGGLVVYSTCSLSRTENHDVVAAFLSGERGRAFRTGSIADIVPAEWGHFNTDEGWFQSLPSVEGPDGHFVARLERQAG